MNATRIDATCFKYHFCLVDNGYFALTDALARQSNIIKHNTLFRLSLNRVLAYIQNLQHTNINSFTRNDLTSKITHAVCISTCVDPTDITDTNNAVVSPSPAPLQTNRTPVLILKKTLHVAAPAAANWARVALRHTACTKRTELTQPIVTHHGINGTHILSIA
jgi:hypothetical protein